MVAALFLAMGQLRDRAVLRVLAGSMLLTLLLFVAAGVVVYALLVRDGACVTIGAAEQCSPALGAFGVAAATAGAMWLLFPAIATGVIGAFSDRIVAAVEQRHYPAAAIAARPPGWARGAVIGLRSAGRLLLYNLLALPGYLLLLVTGVGPIALAVAVNGIVLSRDLWDMVAVRHAAPAAIAAELVETRVLRWTLGLAVAGLFVVPVFNLLAPVLGAATATHLYHRRRR